MKTLAIIPSLAYFLAFGIQAQVSEKNEIFNRNFATQQAKIRICLQNAIDKIKNNNVPVLSEPLEIPTLHDQMEEIFRASEKLILNDNPEILKKHPLYKYFKNLEINDTFTTTLKSGPDIQAFTTLLLKKHGLDTSKAHLAKKLNIQLFNNVETFFRCLDIFKKAYFKHTGKIIETDLSFTLSEEPLESFCQKYIQDNPELIDAPESLLKQLVKLISVFEINNKILDLTITLNMKLQEFDPAEIPQSFKPIFLQLKEGEYELSNEISIGQQDLSKQIQNLSGSELSMPYIKDADGTIQFKILSSLLDRKKLNIVEIGGGRGETNAVFHAIKSAGPKINLLSIEPYGPFAQIYINAHKAYDIDKVKVMQKTAQELTAQDVINYFDGKADVIFASHSFYFILGDLHKATLEYLHKDLDDIENHPLTKYLDMLNDNGILLVTLQSGAGGRLFRNALLGEHGLTAEDDDAPDKTIQLLRSFGNMATFLRHFNFFANRYEQKTGKKLSIKMHYSVANVPLGGLKIERDPKTGAFDLTNPAGYDPEWLGPKMLDFYGNWQSLQKLATLTFEEAQKLTKSELNNLGIEKLDEQLIKQKRDEALKKQETYLHILRAFAPGLVNMQHPNITLEIKIES